MKYLGQPYAHRSPEVMEQRYDRAAHAAAQLFKAGIHVFAPIVHWHKLAQAYNLPREHEPWMKYDLDMLSRCDGLYILCLEGWQESKGLRDEVEFAVNFQKPVQFIENWNDPLTTISSSAVGVLKYMNEVQGK